MIDNNSRDEAAADFGIIAADGAYIQGKDEYVRVLFYRDIAFPKRTSQDKYSFDEANREVLHEVRLPYKPAKVIGMYLTASASIHEDMLNGEETIEPDRSTAPTVTTVSRFMQLIHDIVQITVNLDKAGEDKVVSHIEEFLKQSKPKFDEIHANHPGRMTAE